MPEQLVPVLKVADTERSVAWYARLGFSKQFERRYSEEFPGYVALSRGELGLHLSEHPGDATPDTLVYLLVDDIDAVAAAFEVAVLEDTPGGREAHLTDPDGNRIRVASPHQRPDQ